MDSEINFSNYWDNRIMQVDFQENIKLLIIKLLKEIFNKKVSIIIKIILDKFSESSTELSILNIQLKKDMILSAIKIINNKTSSTNKPINQILNNKTIECWRNFSGETGSAFTKLESQFLKDIMNQDAMNHMLKLVITEVIARVNQKINPAFKLATLTGLDGGCKNNIISPTVGLFMPLALDIMIEFITDDNNRDKFESFTKQLFDIIVSKEPQVATRVWDDEFFDNLSEAISLTLSDSDLMNNSCNIFDTFVSNIEEKHGNLTIFELFEKFNLQDPLTKVMNQDVIIPIKYIGSDYIKSFMEKEIIEFIKQTEDY